MTIMLIMLPVYLSIPVLIIVIILGIFAYREVFENARKAKLQQDRRKGLVEKDPFGPEHGMQC